MTAQDIEKHVEEFDKRFAKISHMHRGECVITDSTGTQFQIHKENGKVTEIGGLESVKDFIRTTLTKVAEEARRDERERIVAWYHSRIESDGELTSAPSGKEIIAYLQSDK